MKTPVLCVSSLTGLLNLSFANVSPDYGPYEVFLDDFGLPADTEPVHPPDFGFVNEIDAPPSAAVDGYKFSPPTPGRPIQLFPPTTASGQYTSCGFF
jgi:hypothetical protein